MYEGKPYARVQLLFDREAFYGQQVLQFKGYLALSDAFKSFFLETIELLNVHIRPQVKQALSEYYGLFLARLAQSFQGLCGAERAAFHGYPYLGYSALRNIFDNTALTSGAMQKLTDFYAIEGVVPGEPFNPTEALKLRKATEFSVREQLTGAKSGLPQETIALLRVWDTLFDAETHGSRLSLADTTAWLKGDAGLPVVPRYEESALSMFMNRFSEVAWMTHRLIPLIQPGEVMFPVNWAEKWKVLDDSFRIAVVSLTEQLGKPIGAVMATFVEAKLPFNTQSTFTYDAYPLAQADTLRQAS